MSATANPTPGPVTLGATYAQSQQVYASCTFDGAEYHIWLDRGTLQATTDAKIFKRVGAERPVYLHLDRGQGKAIGSYLLEEARKLYPAFVASEAAQQAAENEAAEQAKRLEHVKACGPELLEALLLALPFVEDLEKDPGYKPGAVARAVKTIRAAIDKANGSAS